MISLPYAKRIFFSFLAASILTAVMHSIHTKTIQEIQKNQTLELSRQLALQIESLTFYAREQGIHQPIPWAIQMLSLGSENRPIHLRLIKNSEIKAASEKHFIDFSTSSSHYMKILSPEMMIGVEVKIQLTPEGFLGTHSKWSGDLMIGLCFIFIYSFFFLTLKWVIFGNIEVSTSEKTSSVHAEKVVELVLLWAQNNHTALLEFGLKTKKLTQSANYLIKNLAPENLEFAVQDLNLSITDLLKSMMHQAQQVAQLKSSLKNVSPPPLDPPQPEN